MTPIKDAATSPSDDLIAFAITEAFGERCPTADADCYTCQAWDQYDKLNALTTPAPGRDELRERIARIIDPAGWQTYDWWVANNPPGVPKDDESRRRHLQPSLTKADAILSALPAAPVVDEAAPVVVVYYTNWRGETSRRRIIPKSVRYGSTEWHPEQQWLLLAWDDDKQADREFALKDFGARAGGGER